MTPFKFFQLELYYNFIRNRWVYLEIDGYRFGIFTHLSYYEINLELGYIYVGYVSMWDDERNKQTIFNILQSKFQRARIISDDENI